MDMYHKLATSMDELCNAFNSRMNQYETNLKQFTETSDCAHKDLPELSKDFGSFRSLIWQAIKHIRSQMDLLYLGLDRQETASRKKVLLFHGVDCTEVKIVETICDIVTRKLKLQDFSKDDIMACHYLGSDSSRKRPVLVRFRLQTQRDLVWTAKTSLRNSGITISEFLTKSRHAVFIAARAHFGVRNCWTSAGKIVVILQDNTRRKLETMYELQQLRSQYPLATPDDNSADNEVTRRNTPPGKITKPGTRSKRTGK